MYHIYPIQAKPSISSLFSYNWVVFHPLPYVTKGPWSFPLLKLAFCTFKMLSNSTTFFISTSKPGGCGGSAAACWVVGEGRNYTPNKPWWFNKKQGKVSEIEPWNVLSDILFRIFFWLLEVLLFVFGRFCVWSFFRNDEVNHFYFLTKKASSDFPLLRGVFIGFCHDWRSFLPLVGPKIPEKPTTR